jgi:hypothetical protein
MSASSLVKGAGQRAAYGQGAAECEHAETNARAGEAKVASRGGCQDLEDHSARRVCHAGWQLSNRRWAVYLSQQCNLGTPSRSAHGPTRNYSACRQRSHGYLRQSERTARARKRSFRTGDSCDLMRARRRRWQIRVRAGATCEVRWRLAHERSTSTEMNKIRCQTRIDLAVGHPKYPREFTLPSCRFHHVGICGTGERCTAGRVSVYARGVE